MKLHIRDVRLFSNSGLHFPVCKIGKGPLNLEWTKLPTTGIPLEATCKHCIKQYPKKYPWAKKPEKEAKGVGVINFRQKGVGVINFKSHRQL